jgi:hypothetical protein
MTKSSSTFRNTPFIVAILFILALPASVFASVRITAVEYDPAGVDSGHEWIKITNTGSDTVSLADYRLFEGGVNHKLSVTSGTSNIGAGEDAIITTDPSQYLADHTSFTGVVFKSSFSLSNTGETIVLRDQSLKPVDSYSYTAPPKAPAPVKSAKTKGVSTAKTKSAGVYAGGEQAAAVALSDLPALPTMSSVWVYGLGLAALLTVGAGAALYARPIGASVTSSPKEEFELE